MLANAEKLRTAAVGANKVLYEEDGFAKAALMAPRSIWRNWRATIRNAPSLPSATVEQLAATVRDYADSIDPSPERLAEIEDRLALRDRLKRKYRSKLGQRDRLRRSRQPERRD